jgi:hypothetical protein
LLALSCALLVFSHQAVYNNLFLQTGLIVFAQESPTSKESTNSNKLSGVNQSLLEDFRNVVKNQISIIFSEMLSQVDERYANEALGLQIDFPNGWKGTEIKPANSLIISPPEINVTDYLTSATEQGFYSFISSNEPRNDISTQEIFQTAMNSILNEALGSLEQLDPIISVSSMSKDSVKSLQNLSGIAPPTESLASIWYEYTLSALNQMAGNLSEGKNSIGGNKIMSINYSEINGFPTEISVSQSILPESSKPYKTLGYLFLTRDNIVAVEYSAGLENYEAFLPEFENSIGSMNVSNAITISEENIKRFIG